MNSFEYARPKTIPEVFSCLQGAKSVIKAGGIDVLDLLKEGILAPQRLVHLREVQSLKFIEARENGLRIGVNTTLDELSRDSRLSGPYQALAQAAAAAATPQIRHVATLGGNLCQRPHCWYFRSRHFPCRRKGGDTCFAIAGENQNHAILANDDSCVMVHPSAMAVALLALNAQLTIASPKAMRQIPLAQFFVLPAQDVTRENILQGDELLTEVHLPAFSPGVRSFYFKQKAKQSFDWPMAEAAVSLDLDGKTCRDARIVLGAAAPIPWRVPAAENVLKSQVISRELAAKAAAEALREAEPLSQNQYKLSVFQAVLTRTICWAAEIDPFA